MTRRIIGTMWNRDNRNNMNDNFKELYAKYQDYFTEITGDLREALIEGAHIEIKGYVETAAELPTSAESGDTYFVIETGEWQRCDGEVWDVVAKTDTSEFVALRDDFTSLEDKYDTFIQLVDSSITSFKQEVNNTIDDKIGDIEAGVQTFIDQIEGQIIYVEEEGSNSNGQYVRYSDGTQICWQEDVWEGSNAPEKTAIGSIYRSESFRWNFPKSFIDELTVVTTDVSSSSTWSGISSSPSTSGVSYRLFAATSTVHALRVYLYAHGRWK